MGKFWGRIETLDFLEEKCPGQTHFFLSHIQEASPIPPTPPGPLGPGGLGNLVFCMQLAIPKRASRNIGSKLEIFGFFDFA